MSGKCFIDTTILIYLYSIDEVQKREAVEQLLDKVEQPLISTQVINEFINVMLKKIGNIVAISSAVKELSAYFDVVLINLVTIEQALSIATKYRYSYFDSLMISSALEHNCSLLYTEDMHADQIVQNSLKIINPF